MTTYTDNLRWRYATKKFDPSKKLTDTQLQELLDAVQLSASSFGLQAYRVAVITDPAIRTKVREHAWGQPQITEASHLIAFLPMRSIDETYVAQSIDLVSKTRGMPAEALKGYHDMMVGSIKGQTPEGLKSWLRSQAYIAVGFLLSAAAQHGIDACPMEGFDPTHVDVDLGIVDKNLTTAVLVPIGFRASDDATAAYKKVRVPQDELFLKM